MEELEKAARYIIIRSKKLVKKWNKWCSKNW